jgi:hypothetical protein
MTAPQATTDQARAVLARLYQAAIDKAVCASWLALSWDAHWQRVADAENEEARRIAKVLEEMP